MLAIILTIADEEDRRYVEQEYLKHRTRLFAIARKYLPDERDREDCVQDTVLALADCLERYKPLQPRQRKGFLCKCCRSIAINKYHGRKRQKEKEKQLSLEDEDLLKEDFDFFDHFEQTKTILRIKDLLNEMDTMYSDILYFKVFMHMSAKEIADMLGITPNLVNVRLYRAREILKKGLKEDRND